MKFSYIKCDVDEEKDFPVYDLGEDVWPFKGRFHYVKYQLRIQSPYPKRKDMLEKNDFKLYFTIYNIKTKDKLNVKLEYRAQTDHISFMSDAVRASYFIGKIIEYCDKMFLWENNDGVQSYDDIVKIMIVKYGVLITDNSNFFELFVAFMINLDRYGYANDFFNYD